jgi:hypothetical protein
VQLLTIHWILDSAQLPTTRPLTQLTAQASRQLVSGLPGRVARLIRFQPVLMAVHFIVPSAAEILARKCLMQHFMP